MNDIKEIVKKAIENNEWASVRFETSDAEFGEYPDLKIRWVRECKTIVFGITDYLKDAPEAVLAGIVAHILDRISGKCDGPAYPQDAIEYLTSEEFRAQNRPTYLERHQPIEYSSRLTWALKRLQKKGLVDGQDIIIGFGPVDCPQPAKTSGLFRVVIVSDKLKDADKDVLDYVLYKNIADIEQVSVADDPETADLKRELIIERYPGPNASLEAKILKALVK